MSSHLFPQKWSVLCDSFSIARRSSDEFQNLTLEELQHLISTAIGSEIYNEQIEKLFNRVRFSRFKERSSKLRSINGCGAIRQSVC